MAFVVINEGDGEVRNVEVLFESDFETVQIENKGKLEGKNSLVSAEIKAIDPNSIRASIEGFEVIN